MGICIDETCSNMSRQSTKGIGYMRLILIDLNFSLIKKLGIIPSFLFVWTIVCSSQLFACTMVENGNYGYDELLKKTLISPNISMHET